MDNGFATIRIEWDDSANDFDLKIYRDANGDGDLDDAMRTTSLRTSHLVVRVGRHHRRATTIGPDPPPGDYFARVVNYAAPAPTTSA